LETKPIDDTLFVVFFIKKSKKTEDVLSTFKKEVKAMSSAYKKRGG
jgi:hypothetical protein